MSHSFLAYVDESGDEGLSGKLGSSEWFALSAIVTRRSADLQAVKILDQIRGDLGRPPKKPLHFHRLKHDEKIHYVKTLASANRVRGLSVLVHKPSLIRTKTFDSDYRLYFYTARYLLERVSWLCRDASPGPAPGDGTTRVIFSNRSGMRYEDLRSYLALLRYQRPDCRIDWRYIAPDLVEALPPGKSMGLQLADAVAHSFWRAVDPLNRSRTEDAYARLLRPIVYRRSGVFMSYGLKIWPQEALTMLRGEKRGQWLNDLYR